MNIPKSIIKKYNELENNCILIGYRGSIAHDMYISQNNPNSIDDKDVMAVCIPPLDYYFGLKQYSSKGTKEIKVNEWDIVIYEVQKFLSLLQKGNPNVLSLLWLEADKYIHIGKSGKILIEHRHYFATKQVYHSFVGYAYGQLHRMTHHNYQGYMGDKRRKLVEKYGYDVKNASHLIRLLRMGIEFLVEGELYVKRKDKQQLLEIKNGYWTLKQVKNEAKKLFTNIEQVYINSSLPNKPNKEKINDLCINIILEHFKNMGELE